MPGGSPDKVYELIPRLLKCARIARRSVDSGTIAPIARLGVIPWTRLEPEPERLKSPAEFEPDLTPAA
jgi:hypothetical protein